MDLLFMRHGIAIDREDPDCPEESERFLTPKGVKRTREAARGLAALKLEPTRLLSSPYKRAMQTAEITAEAFGVSTDRIETTDALLPEAAPATLFAELKKPNSECVICFGHAPGIDDFIAAAIGTTVPVTAIKKAGIAHLQFDVPTPGVGLLIGIYPPWILHELSR